MFSFFKNESQIVKGCCSFKFYKPWDGRQFILIKGACFSSGFVNNRISKTE